MTQFNIFVRISLLAFVVLFLSACQNHELGNLYVNDQRVPLEGVKYDSESLTITLPDDYPYVSAGTHTKLMLYEGRNREIIDLMCEAEGNKVIRSHGNTMLKIERSEDAANEGPLSYGYSAESRYFHRFLRELNELHPEASQNETLFNGLLRMDKVGNKQYTPSISSFPSENIASDAFEYSSTEDTWTKCWIFSEGLTPGAYMFMGLAGHEGANTPIILVK